MIAKGTCSKSKLLLCFKLKLETSNKNKFFQINWLSNVCSSRGTELEQYLSSILYTTYITLLAVTCFMACKVGPLRRIFLCSSGIYGCVSRMLQATKPYYNFRRTVRRERSFETATMQVVVVSRSTNTNVLFSISLQTYTWYHCLPL